MAMMTMTMVMNYDDDNDYDSDQRSYGGGKFFQRLQILSTKAYNK